MEAGRASMFLNVIPVISLLSGWLPRAERSAPLQLAAVVIAGVTVGSWRSRRLRGAPGRRGTSER